MQSPCILKSHSNIQNNPEMSSEELFNSSALPMCLVCGLSEARYTCPRCNILYCSLPCYKNGIHSGCSEAFYHDQVVTELSSRSDQNDDESRQQMQEILVKLHRNASPDVENLDSDDSEEEDNIGDDLVARLSGVNLDDADAVWQRLSVTEQTDFEKLLKTGGITELLPKFIPWWERSSRFVQEIRTSDEVATVSETSETEGATFNSVNSKSSCGPPSLVNGIPLFRDICKKPVSPCLQYNMANIVATYVFTVRCFNGDHHDWPSHAAYVAWGLSGTLSNNQNYNSVEDAIASVTMFSSQKEGASQEDLTVLTADAQLILSSPSFPPAALSDLLLLFRAALRHRPPTAKGPFSQRFCDGADSQLPRDKLKLAVKKLEFILSWLLNDKNVVF